MAIGEGVDESGLPAAPFLLERIDEDMPGKMSRKLYFVSRSRERWTATISRFVMFSLNFLSGISIAMMLQSVVVDALSR